MIGERPKFELTQSLKRQRQFVAQTGGGHHMLLDDATRHRTQAHELVAAAWPAIPHRCHYYSAAEVPPENHWL